MAAVTDRAAADGGVSPTPDARTSLMLSCLWGHEPCARLLCELLAERGPPPPGFCRLDEFAYLARGRENAYRRPFYR